MLGSSRNYYFALCYCYRSSQIAACSTGVALDSFYRRGSTYSLVAAPMLRVVRKEHNALQTPCASQQNSKFASTQSSVLLSHHMQCASAARNVAKAPSKLPGEARPLRTWPWRKDPMLCLPRVDSPALAPSLRSSWSDMEQLEIIPLVRWSRSTCSQLSSRQS